MDIRPRVMLALTIFVFVITYGACKSIGGVHREGRMNWNSEDVDLMRRKSYVHSPSEFLRLFSHRNDTDDEYVIFRAMYLEAFPEEGEPSNTFTEDKFEEIRKEFESSKCRRPRMKLIDLYDELAIPPEIVISPPAVNLSRCGSNSGCCPKGESCDSTGQNFKSKTIMVLYIDGKHISVKRYNVTEHEECQCRDTTPESSCAPPSEVVRTSPSTCDKKCTSFFQQDSNCQCNRCKSSEEKYIRCNKLMKGERMLSEDQAQCVEEGRCVKPICNVGLLYSPSDRTCIETPISSIL